MFCEHCGCNNSDDNKFCMECGLNLKTEKSEDTNEEIKNMEAPTQTPLIEKVDVLPVIPEIQNTTENTNEITKPTIQQKPPKSKNNKKILILLSVVALIIAGFVVYNLLGGDISKDNVRKELIGKKTSIGRMSITIDENNLKDVKIDSQKITKEDNIKTCAVEGTVLIENEVIKVNASFDATYIYNNNKDVGEKGWLLVDIHISSKDGEKTLEIKKKANEDVFKSSMIDQVIKTVKITEDLSKDIKVTNIEEKDFGTRAIADVSLEYDGKLLNKTVKCKTNIKLVDGQWKFINITAAETHTIVKKIDNISIEDFKKDLSQIGEKWAIQVDFNTMSGTSNFEISELTEVKNLKVSEDTAWNSKRYIIDADVKGVSGKATAEGPIRIGIVEKQVSGTFQLKATSFTVSEPSKDDVIEAIKDKSISYTKDGKSLSYKLKDVDRNTFKLTETVKILPDPRFFAVYGTMSYNGLTDDNIVIIVRYDSGNDKFATTELGSLSDEKTKSKNSIEAIKAKNSKFSEN